MYSLIVLFGVVAAACAQNQRTTPVPILKQINRHNDDGSYTYGYEGADGTFKIETKYATGEVHGKYGYVGDDGKVREVEYGASRRGFEPAGTDINVPPISLANNELDYDDGQYKDEPAAYNEYSRPKEGNKRVGANTSRKFQQQAPAALAPVQTIRYSSPAVSAPAPAPVQNWNYNSAPAPAPTQNWNYNPTPAPASTQNWSWNPTPAPAPNQNWYNPTPAPYQQQGHAANVNYRTGSYTLSYVG